MVNRDNEASYLLVDYLPVLLYHIHPCVHSTARDSVPVFFQGKKKKRKREKLQESTSGRPRVTFQPILLLMRNVFKAVCIFLFTALFFSYTVIPKFGFSS